MPGQRAAGQKLINIPVDDEFLAEIDEGIKHTSYDNRSAFIRDAIVEKLKREGYAIRESLAKPPPRLGKGGPVSYKKHLHSAKRDPADKKSRDDKRGQTNSSPPSDAAKLAQRAAEDSAKKLKP